ncbi:S-protein homolog 74-like [Mercurialis annua]|uniref:S-protein homolog 74-like n=1 Tax=Mercurialis annua TaxID=3986 RepID=UPI00215EFF38|nr:S-protein homolog 74-like [Mercurialis annua]
MNTIECLFISTLVLSFFITPNNCLSFDPYYVHITSQLSHGKTLLLHCQSKDNDLHVQYLKPNATFSWHFKLNVFESTLFWCYMAPDDHHHADFKVFYVNSRFLQKCNSNNEFFWIIKDEGAYVKNIPKGIDDFQHEWESN